jgi:acyl carrier protein
VKVRGFRVEPGEVETALAAHPAVRDAVVAVRGEGAARALVGYVVPAGLVPPSPAALRAFLAERLPEYMVPAAWVVLDALPLSPNGKVDRRALPVPAQTERASAAAFRAPRTPVEARLAEIWAEVLKVERVGVDDDFFELGGHSLLATQVVSRIRDAFGANLPLRRVFENPTVARVAVAVVQARAALMDRERLARALERIGGLPPGEAAARPAEGAAPG